MATRKQHYVPRTYLTSWETKVETQRDPSIKFDGVYCFDDSARTGDGRNVSSILWQPHLYTIGFDKLYIAVRCPRIYSYFINVVYEFMKNNAPNPVYGKLGYSVIKKKESIRKHLIDIEKWDFFYYNNTPAKSKSIINKIKNINCYLLEEQFSNAFETKWQSIKNTFLTEVKSNFHLPSINGGTAISKSIAEEMLRFFIMMQCRSPQFDPIGVYSWAKTIMEGVFGKDKIIDEMIEAVWFTELYRMFYKSSGGYYHTLFEKAKEKCQIILYETYPNSGSFITTDNPAFRHISAVETANMNGFYFPIDPNHLLMLGKGNDGINVIDYRMADKDTIRLFNRVISAHKTKAIVSCEKDLNAVI